MPAEFLPERAASGLDPNRLASPHFGAVARVSGADFPEVLVYDFSFINN
jgi:hypothetical protein